MNTGLVVNRRALGVLQTLSFAVVVSIVLANAAGDEPVDQRSTSETSTAKSKSDGVEKLLRERLQILVEIAKSQDQAFRQGEASFDALLSSQKDVLDAKLELAKTPAERILVREELVENARKLQEVTEQMVRGGEASRIDLLKAKALRLRAEADLLQERGGKS